MSVILRIYPEAVPICDLLIRLLERNPLQEQLRSRLAVAEALTDGGGVGRLLRLSLAVLNNDAPALRGSLTLIQQSSQAEVLCIAALNN